MISNVAINWFISTLFIFGPILFACNETKNQEKSESKVIVPDFSTSLNELEEIERLIQDVYTWHDNNNPTSIGMISDLRDSMYIGYNLSELDLATKDLVESDFFTDEFIENYASIHLAVDKKLKKKEIEWLVGELPNFGSDAEPWCNCQDTPFDLPNPWSKIEIETLYLGDKKGNFYWKWGGLRTNTAPGWYSFKYHFRVEKIGKKWKISYLEGFNLEDFTRVNYQTRP